MEQILINSEDYKLRVTKTWVSTTKIWHIQFLSQSVYDHTFELFLTEEELQKLRDAL
jgi:hypothetical protein